MAVMASSVSEKDYVAENGSAEAARRDSGAD